MSTSHPSIPDRYKIPKQLKLTTKYTDEDRAEVKRLYSKGIAQREIARTIPMSRRMVSFILFPERYIICKKQFQERQKTGRYRYDTKVQSAMVAKVRDRKRKILSKLIKKDK